MLRITIDEELQKKLLVSDEMIELYDSSEKLLGRLLPEIKDPLTGWEPIGPEPTEEELREAYQYDGPGITTEELIAHLRRTR